jgi:hypothetical protein
MFKLIDKDKLTSIILTTVKIISFLSLVMTVVIKTRILLGLPTGNTNTTKEKDKENEDKS